MYKMAGDITSALNTGKIPSHLITGRVVPLSKKKGEKVVHLDDIRPIVIKSHITKIMDLDGKSFYAKYGVA